MKIREVTLPCILLCVFSLRNEVRLFYLSQSAEFFKRCAHVVEFFYTEFFHNSTDEIYANTQIIAVRFQSFVRDFNICNFSIHFVRNTF